MTPAPAPRPRSLDGVDGLEGETVREADLEQVTVVSAQPVKPGGAVGREPNRCAPDRRALRRLSPSRTLRSIMMSSAAGSGSSGVTGPGGDAGATVRRWLTLSAIASFSMDTGDASAEKRRHGDCDRPSRGKAEEPAGKGGHRPGGHPVRQQGDAVAYPQGDATRRAAERRISGGEFFAGAVDPRMVQAIGQRGEPVPGHPEQPPVLRKVRVQLAAVHEVEARTDGQLVRSRSHGRTSSVVVG